MGAVVSSAELRPEEIDDLQQISHFSRREIRRLYKRFRRIDRSSRGVISKDDLLMIPELAMNPLALRIIELFSPDSDGINFRLFVAGLSVFHEKAPHQEKLDYFFRAYDVDGDNRISASDLRKVISMLVGTNLSAGQIDELVTNTLAAADSSHTGSLSRADFEKAISLDTLQQRLSVSFSDM